MYGSFLGLYSRQEKPRSNPQQVISFLAGYITQDLRYTLAAGAGGTLLTFLAVIPPWPFYNKNPAKWLPARDSLAGISVSQ